MEETIRKFKEHLRKMDAYGRAAASAPRPPTTTWA